MAAQNALEALVENMTLRQLADKTGRSVSELVEWSMRSTGGGRKAAAPAAAVASKGPKPKARGVDVRKPAGRAAYDDAVLEIVTNAASPTSAQEVRKRVGGTPAQARAALNRLIASGALGYQGRARATRYFPKGG